MTEGLENIYGIESESITLNSESISQAGGQPCKSDLAFDVVYQQYSVLVDRLHTIAEDLLDDYMKEWSGVNDTKLEKNEKDIGRMQFFIRQRDGLLEIVWKKHTGRKTKPHRNGKSNRITDHIAKNTKTYRYNFQTLKSNCLDWEWPIVRKYEERLAKIRQCYDQVMRSKDSARYAQATLKKISYLGEENV